MGKILLFIAVSLTGSLALAQLNAVWVIRDYEIVGGRLREYVGSKTFRVASDDDVLALAGQVKRQAKPARWVYDKKRGWVALQRRGYEMDPAAALLAFHQAVSEGRSQFIIPVRISDPSPSVVDWANRGVVALIGEGVSNFWGSSWARIHNIRAGAKRLNDTWIPQGAVFSFNKAVGEVDEKHGFVESLVIVGDATEKGVGGGICQVSTTTFRAGFFAGLPVLERHPHSYVLHYYKPLGLDATIYQPWRDLKFKNDTPGDILILTQVKGHKLYVRFFGSPDRKVEWSGPEVSDRKPPLKPREIVDETLKPGARKQVDWAAPGVTAVIRRTVNYDDGRVLKGVFKSVYRPWGNVYLVGPKPEPQPLQSPSEVPLPPLILPAVNTAGPEARR